MSVRVFARRRHRLRGRNDNEGESPIANCRSQIRDDLAGARLSSEYNTLGMLRAFGLVDEARLKQILADGTAMKARNFGQESYAKLCKYMGVKPYTQPMGSMERATKLRMLIKGHKTWIKRLQAELENPSNAPAQPRREEPLT